MKAICRIILVACLENAALHAQAHNCTHDVNLDFTGVTFETAPTFPSLVPIQYLRIGLGPIQVLAPGGDWLKDIANYQVLVDKKPVPIGALQLTNDQHTAFLTFPPGVLTNGRKVEVHIAVVRDGNWVCAQQTNPLTITGASQLDGSVAASWVPQQALTTGAKRDVGHLDIRLEDKSLSAHSPARLYLKGVGTISTDGKDKSSQIVGTLGAELAPLKSWYLPLQFENKVSADQILANVSDISSAGMRTVFPWRWVAPLLFNPAVKAPLSPELDISAQFERRIQQDAASRKKFMDPNAFRLYSEFNWTPIHLFTGKGYSANDLSVEFSGKGWYLPNQRNGAGRRFDRLEGLAELSVLFPVGALALPIFQSGDKASASSSAAKQRIRFKYTRGAIEATGFKHVSQFSIGVEAVK